MREQMLNALRAYYTGQIEKAKMNIENLITNSVGVAEHPDHFTRYGHWKLREVTVLHQGKGVFSRGASRDCHNVLVVGDEP